MDEQAFQKFLKKGGRSVSAAKRVSAIVQQYAQFLQEQRGQGLDTADHEDLEAFVAWVEQEPKTSAKTHLWAIRYYYQYSENEAMTRLASALRQARITRTPFSLGKFRGVRPEHAKNLAAAGVRNVKQMLKAGATPAGRRELAESSGVPPEAILELVRLSDLARIPGIKGIRARLYYDAGVDTIEKMAQWDPEKLRAMLTDFVERTGFDGIAPLPAEARFSVTRAQKLPKIVDYEE